MIKTVSEILNSTKDSISKKSESPLIGSFLTAWVIWNWQPILYFIFLDQGISAKIEKALSYKSWWDQFFTPALISIFYVLALPYIQIVCIKLLKKYELFQYEIILEKKKQSLDEEHNQKLDLINKQIELENKEKDLREQSAINKQINDLKEQIKSKEYEIEHLMENQSHERQSFENRIKRDNEDFQSQLSNLESELQKVRKINKELNNQINKFKQKEMEIQLTNLNSATKTDSNFGYISSYINNKNLLSDIAKNATTYNKLLENNNKNNELFIPGKSVGELAKNANIHVNLLHNYNKNNKLLEKENSLNELIKNTTAYGKLLDDDNKNNK